jgi:hypothetical protein
VLCFSAAVAEEGKVLCDPSCVSALESKEMVTTPSGLQYKEIVPGTGPQAITGYQVRAKQHVLASAFVVHAVAGSSSARGVVSLYCARHRATGYYRVPGAQQHIHCSYLPSGAGCDRKLKCNGVVS